MKWKGLLSKFLFGVSAIRILKIIISRTSYLSRKLSEAYIVLKWSCPKSSVILLFCSFLFFHFGFSLFYFFFSSFSFPSTCWASQHPGCVFPLLAGFLTGTQYVRWCTTLTFPPTAESWWSQWSLWCTLLLKVSELAVTVQSAHHLLFCFDFSLFAVGFRLFVVCWYVVRFRVGKTLLSAHLLILFIISENHKSGEVLSTLCPLFSFTKAVCFLSSPCLLVWYMCSSIVLKCHFMLVKVTEVVLFRGWGSGL